MSPIQMILNTIPQLTRANVALDNVKKLGLVLTRRLAQHNCGVNLLSANWQNIEFKSVRHCYLRENDTREFVLGPIDLRFRAGEIVFITGGNGSGKTTFLKLLTSLYLPEHGHVSLDGIPITEDNKESYRQLFSTVFSDFYLFERLVGAIGKDLDAQARHYLTELKLSHKVEIANGKLSRLELSQGQRKRLALLTAYVEDRSIVIFDEWAADQDPQFRALFYLHILPELKARGKTIFAVTHDDRYYHVADRLVKLDEGRIVSDTAQVAQSMAQVG
jgi:putative ATP-binding cassette transporter